MEFEWDANKERENFHIDDAILTIEAENFLFCFGFVFRFDEYYREVGDFIALRFHFPQSEDSPVSVQTPVVVVMLPHKEGETEAKLKD
jgi:hypothetical protein